MSIIFHQNIICIIWDFDKTLISHYMQKPIFEDYNVDEQKFWNEVNSLVNYYQKQGIRVSKDTVYLNHILTYVKEGIFKNLNNKMLHNFGKRMQFYPGLPKFFQDLKDLVSNNEDLQKYEIKLEHYIVSTGLAEIIKGSEINTYVDGIWGCEFIEVPAKPGYLDSKELDMNTADKEISMIGYTIDNTTKTRAIFEINKGTNYFSEIDVNDKFPMEHRRIPFKNMIYIADGPSDIPVFSLLNKMGGLTAAVYNSDSDKEFDQVEALHKTNRIKYYGEADYRHNRSMYRWLRKKVLDIGNRIAAEKSEYLERNKVSGPNHIA